MITHSTFEDFIVFLYVHISHADNNYDPSEMATIKKKMTTLFSKETDIEKKLYTTIRQYNSFDKSKLNELLKESFQHFTEKHGNSEGVFADLLEIIQADGKEVLSETKTLQSLKQIIDQHAEKNAV